MKNGNDSAVYPWNQSVGAEKTPDPADEKKENGPETEGVPMPPPAAKPDPAATLMAVYTVRAIWFSPSRETSVWVKPPAIRYSMSLSMEISLN